MIARVFEWCRQPDVRTNVVRALWRRVRWRWYWRRPDAPPLRVSNWWRGLEINLAHSGSSAVAYYRNFDDDPIVRGMERLVTPGMTIIDVGSHAGAYALVAGHLIGDGGRVIAMEPQPGLAGLVRRNAEANGFTGIRVDECAVGATSGTVAFNSDSQTQGGWMTPDGGGAAEFMVPLVTLDEIRANEGSIGFVKLDAAGFELAGLEGGRHMLAQPDAPQLAVKFYGASVVAGRAGVDGDDQRKFLQDLGYALFELVGDRWQPFARSVAEYSVVVIATRTPDALVA